jgi:cholesterol oxidase
MAAAERQAGERQAGELDYDWVVIGSGFGGSVSALRLSQKGYRVAVLEAGRRFADAEFARSTWNLRRFLWAPVIGLRGVMRMYFFKDVVILAGAGVGGGSLVYANTLYQPGSEFFQAPEWRGLADWERTLAPYYAEAKRMLGAAPVPFRTDADDLLKLVGEQMGVGDSYRRPEVSVYFEADDPDRAPASAVDPYFGGEGPTRTPCNRCGSCMIGCRVGAKNTLVKNYLWFAERGGAEVQAERTVKEIRPLGAQDGSDGYSITSVRSGAWARKRRETITARGLVVAGGAMGTNLLLARAKHTGALPRLSDRVGQQVRTNSEALLAVTAKDDRHRRRGDQLEHLPGRQHAHRERHLRPRRWVHEPELHAADRRRLTPDPAVAMRGAGHPPSVQRGAYRRAARQLVTPDDDSARHADAAGVVVADATAGRQAADAHDPPGP